MSLCTGVLRLPGTDSVVFWPADWRKGQLVWVAAVACMLGLA